MSKNPQKYSDLTSKQKKVLQTIALFIDASATPEKLVRIFQKLKHKDLGRTQIVTILKAIRENFLLPPNRCAPEYWSEVIFDALEQPYFPQLCQAVVYELKTSAYFNVYYFSHSLLAIAILQKDNDEFTKISQYLDDKEPQFMIKSSIVYGIFEALPFSWAKQLPPTILCYYLHDFLHKQILYLLPIEDKWKKLILENLNSCSESHLVRKQWANVLFLQGKVEEAFIIASVDLQDKRPYPFMLRGIDLFQQQKIVLAWEQFSLGITAYRRISRQSYFEDFYPFFALVCVLFSDKKNRLEQFQKLIHRTIEWDDPYSIFCETLFLLEEVQNNHVEQAKAVIEDSIDKKHLHPMIRFFIAIIAAWIKEPAAIECDYQIAKSLVNSAHTNGYNWIANNLSAALDKLSDSKQPQQDNLLVNAIKFPAIWERSLQLVTNYLQQQTQGNRNKRLIWFLQMSRNNCKFFCKEQKIGANGKWTKGKEIRFSYGHKKYEYLTEQDRRIIDKMDNRYYNYTSEGWQHTLLEMVGHPLVFWQNKPSVAVEITKESPFIELQKTSHNYTFSFPHSINSDVICQVDGNKITLIALNERQQKIVTLLGKKLVIPIEAKEQIENVTKLITAEMDIFSPSTDMGNIESISAESQIFAKFQKIFTNYYRVDLVVKPFGDEEEFIPGNGKRDFFDAQTKKFITRDLKEEIKNTKKLLKLSSTKFSKNYDGELDTEQCLDLLLTWKDKVIIEWADKENIRVNPLDSFSFKVVQKKDWFEIDSKIKIDEKRVWDLKKLLKNLGQKNYIQLTDDHFAVITSEMREKLEYLSSCLEKQKIHNALAPNVNEILEDFNEVEYAENWQKQIAKIAKIRSGTVTVPKTFKAKLRPYQKEGFLWLSQLGKWGVGACLADDMGLGKTIQALALLLKNKSQGASLVIAPTSVCINWAMECKKFAPSLSPHVFNTLSSNDMIKKLTAGDLLITSYGILQHREDVFTKKKWNVIVLDEAQSIKNIHAKRTKASLKLKSKYRIITTGTPVENNLSELWTLFHFLNPGLLGSLETFKTKFILPIEGNKSSPAMTRLKKIVSPFILRRTKGEVLKDLPPKIEKSIYVDMSSEEKSFYEALRQTSIERIENAEEKGGQKHIQILAEITRLRRACCHSQLVYAKSNISSSKLAIFKEILDEILQNGDKVLVFSQFVDYLKMVEKIVKKQKISYQYLDGSTPQKKRQKRIDDFQDGKASVFLISLKAGGVGLNLTAANFVVHLDPWWNPAVEDQATDRAHRIGQKKIVTVYRLITNNTIEQKIISLHEEKRDLASKILQGSDKPNKLDTKMLLKLLME